MTADPDAVASVVLDEFDRLPVKRKPLIRDNGQQEWVPLSGIVAQVDGGSLTCLSLATGMKCLPANKMHLANGGTIHDWHAEILAIRAFNYFVLEECRNIALHGRTSDYLRLRSETELTSSASAWHGQPFAWRDGVTLHMYCSESPCGDASMELTMAAQDDSSPWDLPPTAFTTTHPPGTLEPGTLPGRGYFSKLGIVRRKPARGDAPPTMSKSCSDKIALNQCTSLLSGVTSMFVSPRGVYVNSLVLPESQYSETGCQRAWSAEGRMKAVIEHAETWKGGYGFHPFQVRTTSREFAYSKRSVAARAGPATVATSNLAVAWSKNGLEETTTMGVLQGRKQFDVRGASRVSRRKMWGLALEIAAVLGVGFASVPKALIQKRYEDVKNSSLLMARQRVKTDAKATALQGWVRNVGDSDFSILR